MLKSSFQKLPPKMIEYRLWKNFEHNLFRNDLSQSLGRIDTYLDFEQTFTQIFDKNAPKKTKFLRGNNQPHLTKALL